LNNPAPPKEAGFFVAIVATKKNKKKSTEQPAPKLKKQLDKGLLGGEPESPKRSTVKSVAIATKIAINVNSSFCK
jgi:hypothetical protein